MERGDRAPVATFYAPELATGVAEVSLGEFAARHARVRRLAQGDVVRLTNGSGRRGLGTIAALRKVELIIEVSGVEAVPPLPPLEVLPPVADRDRMLWLAEKCAELAVSVWQPVTFARSRSVTPRGAGVAFAAKVRARMIAALEQSGGGWLPEVRAELPLEGAVGRVTVPGRYLLDRQGARLDAAPACRGAAVVFGPEGGLEPEERSLLERLGWQRVALAPTTLRFETAGIAAVAILRARATTADAEV